MKIPVTDTTCDWIEFPLFKMFGCFILAVITFAHHHTLVMTRCFSFKACSQNHKPLKLEKTSKIIESNHEPLSPPNRVPRCHIQGWWLRHLPDLFQCLSILSVRKSFLISDLRKKKPSLTGRVVRLWSLWDAPGVWWQLDCGRKGIPGCPQEVLGDAEALERPDKSLSTHSCSAANVESLPKHLSLPFTPSHGPFLRNLEIPHCVKIWDH